MTPVDRPRVTVGLPVYNGARFLRETLDSLLAQTFEDFELIICDNASTDDTPQICKEYAAKDSRIRYERQSENVGAAANYNRTFELGTGEFFKWSAHDDLCRPRFLEECMAAFDEAGGNTPAVVHPKAVLIDESGELIRADTDELALDAEDPVTRFRHVIRNVRAANTVFGLFPRNVLEKTQLIAPHEASDWILLAEIALNGPIVCLDDVLFERRIHDDASLRAIKLRGGGRRETVAWWDTRRVRLRTLVPFDVRTSYALFRAAARAPLGRRQRVRAWMVVPRVYWTRLIRFHGGRLKRRLRGESLNSPAVISGES
ncbi:glycosyltransferase [Phytoactinopolyspora halotolerans]|uniref:Glycosyltransferase n=1 Tax=Phytoactinopolyspora halotolerans TaxID=1981512 RepID=A0A6L9S340_9ACTN|nr:glycosyltransferase [Phytoactinopolyspora halotolerans]NED99615.1 glycosyltransferase [Phytoactinopolyspora halotolerans]